MTDQLPERIWIVRSDGAHFVESSPADLNLLGPGADQRKYLSADTAIPKSEADAMVAAARRDAAYVAAHACLVEPDGGSPTPEEIAVCDEASRRILARTPANARAAFDRAVREAVEKERERCARIAASFTPDDEWDRGGLIAAAIRAPQEPSE